MWFWRLLGWRRYEYGTNILWIRGARSEQYASVVGYLRSPYTNNYLVVIRNRDRRKHARTD